MLEKINKPNDLKKLNLIELEILSEEIRKFLIENVMKTGGHLSPNLGVVELTVALHYVFNCPEDDIIWDVGHQSYIHKILTGRKDRFNSLRMMDGLSGYPSPKESQYDCVHAGHSSTSLSVAAGMAKAKILKNRISDTIAIIGDGAFTGGIAYEALNNISHDNLPVIIILNDNGMSISKNVGGISRYLKKLQLSHSYLRFKHRLEKVVKTRVPLVGGYLVKIMYGIKELFKSILVRKNFFEDMGISYYGPIDGHDLKKIIEVFHEIRGINKPIIIHIVTTKGKGYKPSEDNPGKYHGISGVSINGDGSIPIEKESLSYSSVFGNALADIARVDKKVVAITAAMKSGAGLKKFAEEFPERFIDVGIAEQHAVDMAFGLSLKGIKPVVAIYSTFLQRGLDQMIHDIGIAEGKVLFCLDRAGLVPGDGETHQGIFDISYCRMIPNFTIMLPATKNEFIMMLENSIKNLNSPICIRYPKDEALDYPWYSPELYPITRGEGVIVASGSDFIIVSTGTLLGEAFEVKKNLSEKKGYQTAANTVRGRNSVDIEIFNLRFAKPINENILKYLSGDSRPVLILEEGIFNGGIAEYLIDEIYTRNKNKIIRSINIPDEYPSIGTRAELLNRYSLTSQKINNKILELLNECSI